MVTIGTRLIFAVSCVFSVTSPAETKRHETKPLTVVENVQQAATALGVERVKQALYTFALSGDASMELSDALFAAAIKDVHVRAGGKETDPAVETTIERTVGGVHGVYVVYPGDSTYTLISVHGYPDDPALPVAIARVMPLLTKKAGFNHWHLGEIGWGRFDLKDGGTVTSNFTRFNSKTLRKLVEDEERGTPPDEADDIAHELLVRLQAHADLGDLPERAQLLQKKLQEKQQKKQ